MDHVGGGLVHGSDTTGAATTTRALGDLTGGLAATASTGAVSATAWQLTGLHGDIERTTSTTATVSPDGPVTMSDEYGVTTSTSRYGYLGAHQRAGDDLTALTYMGVRIYASTLGRFLQTDPIFGGNLTSYGYPGDPVSLADISGAAPEPPNDHSKRRYAIGKNCGYVTCSLYLSMDLVRYIQRKIDRFPGTTAALVTAAAGMFGTACGMAGGGPWAVVVCASVVGTFGLFALDQIAEASRRYACIRVRYVKGTKLPATTGIYVDRSDYCLRLG